MIEARKVPSRVPGYASEAMQQLEAARCRASASRSNAAKVRDGLNCAAADHSSSSSR